MYLASPYYPYTLKREWYTADVCASIHASLEGAKYWTSFDYVGAEKAAYLETFEECQQLVKKHDLKPQEMLKALSDLHDDLIYMPKPSFFSAARWFSKAAQAREAAVRTAFELVDGISSRYLPGE